MMTTATTIKKYFAKYLPVEGEIKNGDKILFQREKIISFNEIDQSMIDNYPLYYEKVKLFLYSRDIQIGDKAHCDLCNEDFTVHEEWKQEHDEDKVYKIIGEISLEATWVKEGMEFDENEVEMWYWSDYIAMDGKPEGFTILVSFDKEPKLTNEQLETMQWKRVAQLKGPCGHFH